MRKFLVFCAGVFFTTPVSAQHNQPLQLTSEDQAVIQRFVADETALPERTQVTSITAVRSAQGSISACGYVRWIDGSGLYGPYRPFQGILATNTEGRRVFAIVGIARDAQDQQILETLCAQRGAPISLGVNASSDTPPPNVAKLIDAARELDRRCRGVEGADPSSTICDDRNAAFEAVNDFGWCYGKDDQASYQYEWHACGPNSIGR